MGFSLDDSCCVSSSIDVIGNNWLGKFFQGKFEKVEKANINEVSCGSAVNESSGFDGLCSIR